MFHSKHRKFEVYGNNEKISLQCMKKTLLQKSDLVDG